MERGETLLVLLPTLNEGKNIEPLLERLAVSLEGVKATILVVDDGSTDGTREKVRAFSHPKLAQKPVLLERTKDRWGCQRGAAVLAGFEWGLAQGDFTAFVEMDADLSHQPEEIKAGLAALRERGCQVAIGSKYLPASKVVQRHWSRRLLSRVANGMARLLLDPAVRDYSNGFRLYDRTAVELIVSRGLHYTSPIGLSEILALLMVEGMHLTEFPATYVGRFEGLSKQTPIDIVKAALGLFDISARYHGTRPSRGRSVLVLAAALVLAGGLWAFFTDRPQDMDELGLFNVAYCAARKGELAFPAHGQQDALTVHPPSHYLAVAAALKAGLPPYYAEAAPAFLLLLVLVLVVTRGPFATEQKLALLFGGFGTWVVHGITGFRFEIVHFGFGMRPELSMSLAWFAGLVALEAGRLKGFAPRWLFLGSALLTWASTLHYPASFAWLGVLVYAVWARRQRSALLALGAGGALVGLPYFFGFVLPNLHGILHTVRAHDSVGGPLASFAAHRDYYLAHGEAFPRLAPLLGIARAGIPPAFVAIALLAASRTSRGIALAAAPYLLFLVFCVQGKSNHRGYFMPELSLYFTALALVAVSALAAVLERFVRGGRGLAAPGAAAALVLVLAASPIVRSARVSTTPRLLESEVARWSGKELLGPRATVGARMSLWYASGGVRFRQIVPDLFWRRLSMDAFFNYVDRFDAIAEGPWRTYETTPAGVSLPSLYARGDLALRGFYFSATCPQLTYGLFARKRTGPLAGFGRLESGDLLRFEERAQGDYAFAAVVSRETQLSVPRTLFRGIYPYLGEDREPRYLHTLVAPWEELQGAVSGPLRDAVRMRVLALGPETSLVDLSQDPPIDFPRSPEDLRR